MTNQHFALPERCGAAQDGVLQVCGAGTLMLFSDEGKLVGRDSLKGCRGMPEGVELQCASWEVEVQGRLPEAPFLSDEVFLPASAPLAASASLQHGAKAAPSAAVAAAPKPAFSAAPFRPVFGGGAAVPNSTLAQPLHDPAAPGALVLCTAGDSRCATPGHSGGAACAVVVDPHIAARLRPHQREGVAFMFDAVSGATAPQHAGCLLADAAGVGKTLQVLALIWTLLRQSPAGGGIPALRRAVVVCPDSLVAKWKAETAKWLGAKRLGVLALQSGGGAAAARDAVAGWATTRQGQTQWPLLVLSYETLRACAAEVAAAAPGLLVCDEAHHLTSAGGSKTLATLRSLGARRRVLLIGTPVCNNLDEFFSMMDFATPGLLGDVASFRYFFAEPIAASRDAVASADAKRVGGEHAALLNRLAAPFMLLRTADVNTQYLPPKQEYVVFCRPSTQQAALYSAFLKLPEVRKMLTSCDGCSSTRLSPVVAITMLHHLCASPAALLRAAASDEAEVGNNGSAAATGGPSEASVRVMAAMRGLCWLRCAALTAVPHPAAAAIEASSGKMAVLAAILRRVASVPGDRCVVVTAWTCTLDAVAALCAALLLPSSRLDDSTPTDMCANMVRRFNDGAGGVVFLLSTRTGSVDISLVGASRLVMFDSALNPARDAQTLSRVWRDGQCKPVTVYRLLTAGSIEEKIHQLQLMKDKMAPMVQSNAACRHFSVDELRRLFVFCPPPPDTAGCETAELLQGDVGGAAVAALWRDVAVNVKDAPLVDAVAGGAVSFVHAPPANGSAAALAAEAELLSEDTGAVCRAETAEADAEVARMAAGHLSMWTDDDKADDGTAEVDSGDDDGTELEAADVPPKRRRLRRKADVGGAFVPIGVLALTMTPTTDDA